VLLFGVRVEGSGQQVFEIRQNAIDRVDESLPDTAV